MAEVHRGHQAPLVSRDQTAGWAHQDPLVLSVRPDHLDLLAKRVLLVSVETMDPTEDRAREGHQDQLEVQVTKGTPEKMDLRVLMGPQARPELQAREASLVFLVKGESEACWAFQDQRVHQGNKATQGLPETRVPLAQLGQQEPTGLEEMLVLMGLLDLTGRQARKVSQV